MSPEQVRSPGDVPPSPASTHKSRSSIDDEYRKRKASTPGQRSNDEFPKRTRQESDDRDFSSHRRGSRADSAAVDSQGRRPSVTQEDKDRGKRLFGGLISALNQTGSSTQQKRRQEIEHRQQLKMREKTAEEDKRRAEKKAELHKTRMEQQIHLDEQVMRNRHAQELRLAQFLRTKAKPAIYYRPYRLTEREEEIIDDQIKDVKVEISRDLEDFKHRKERHLRRYGLVREAHVGGEATPVHLPEPDIGPPPSPKPSTQADADEQQTGLVEQQTDGGAERQAEAAEQTRPKEAPQHAHHHHHHHHHDAQDDSCDMLMEGEEDMVIY